MKNFVLCLSVLCVLFIISSCGHKTNNDLKEKKKSEFAKTDSQKLNYPDMHKGPSSLEQANKKAAIQINKSVVIAEIIESHVKDSTNFLIVAKTLDVKEDPAYPSLAVKGEIYQLFPGFVLGKDKEPVDNRKNQKLRRLKNLTKGQNFKAIIYLDDSKRWIIQDIISD
ncbi:MAG: hypothetical protein Q8933_21515 [Bacteroidota bacterium]|nr:hypothetical protein [Bacteroidota bacterium]